MVGVTGTKISTQWQKEFSKSICPKIEASASLEPPLGRIRRWRPREVRAGSRNTGPVFPAAWRLTLILRATQKPMSISRRAAAWFHLYSGRTSPVLRMVWASASPQWLGVSRAGTNQLKSQEKRLEEEAEIRAVFLHHQYHHHHHHHQTFIASLVHTEHQGLQSPKSTRAKQVSTEAELAGWHPAFACFRGCQGRQQEEVQRWCTGEDEPGLRRKALPCSGVGEWDVKHEQTVWCGTKTDIHPFEWDILVFQGWTGKSKNCLTPRVSHDFSANKLASRPSAAQGPLLCNCRYKR